MAHHVLSLDDRGTLYYPSCSCGWVGVPRRHRREAETQYRNHKAEQDALDRRRLRPARAPHQQPLTPTDRLPEELR